MTFVDIVHDYAWLVFPLTVLVGSLARTCRRPKPETNLPWYRGTDD